MKNMTVAFTGYRPEKMPFKEEESDESYARYRELLERVIERLIERGCTNFISGMALGFDTWCAEDVLKLGGQLECAIPFMEQDSGWSDEAKARRLDLISRSAKSTIVSSVASRGAYLERNRYMVDNADVVIAGYSGNKSGGTAYTVRYALAQGKIVIQVNPITNEVSYLSTRRLK